MAARSAAEQRTTARGSSPVPELDRFYRANWLQLVRLAGALVGDKQSAEDVVQDVMVRMQGRWAKMEGNEQDALAYVRRAVVNGCRSAHRHTRARNRRETAYASALAYEGVGDAEAIALAASEAAEIRNAIARLPRRQREVLVLRYLCDLSVRETAGALSVTEEAVKSSTSRALRSIQCNLDKP